MKFIQSLFVFILLITITTKTYAQDQEERKTEFSIEVDPITFGFGGYGFHIRLKPQNTDHLLIGLGAYGMNMPQFLVNINSNNRDKGWNVRLNQGYGVFAEHYFSEVNQKWFVGGQIGVQQYKIEKDAIDDHNKFTNLLFMAYGGYTWQPFGFNLYIKPWFGVGYTSKIDGETTVNNSTYEIFPITFFATLHIGYTF